MVVVQLVVCTGKDLCRSVKDGIYVLDLIIIYLFFTTLPVLILVVGIELTGLTSCRCVAEDRYLMYIPAETVRLSNRIYDPD